MNVNCFPEDNSGPKRLSNMPEGRSQSATQYCLLPSPQPIQMAQRRIPRHSAEAAEKGVEGAFTPP